VAKAINILAFITLFEMMITIGLRVTVAQVAEVARNGRLLLAAAVANYVIAPMITVALLLWFGADPLVSAGFVIIAACPGAPYAPPFTAMAKGNVMTAVGLMFLLAASSAVLAPLLLRLLLPIVGAEQSVRVNVAGHLQTLAVGQFVPLCMGVGVRHWRPALAARAERPAARVSTLLNLVLVVILLVVQFPTLARIRVIGYVAMLALLIASMAGGWILGGAHPGERRTLAIVTGVRNAGVGLLIAINMLPGTAAVSAATAYALVQTLAAAGIAFALGRLPARNEPRPLFAMIAPRLTKRSP
jgi:BASS family bile acid:Na+ symporter